MYSSLLNCELLKIHKEPLSKLPLNKIPIITSTDHEINKLTDIIVGVEFLEEHNPNNKFQLKFYDNDMGCKVPLFTQKIIYNQPIKFQTLQFPARSAYNTKISLHVCNIAERMAMKLKANLLTYTLPQHLQVTLLKTPQQYLLPNGSGIRIYNGYTNFIISSSFSNSSLFKVNNYLIRLYYAKKIKHALLTNCYPVKKIYSTIEPSLCQKIVNFIDSVNDIEELDEEELQDKIFSAIATTITTDSELSLNCYKYEADETINNSESSEKSTTALVNLTDAKYIFQSRTKQFTLKQGDLLRIPPSIPYKLISPKDTDKYLLEIRY